MAWFSFPDMTNFLSSSTHSTVDARHTSPTMSHMVRASVMKMACSGGKYTTRSWPMSDPVTAYRKGLLRKRPRERDDSVYRFEEKEKERDQGEWKREGVE